MPIIWRYILGQYLKVLGLSVVAFIALLLTTRLEEIAHFATLGAESVHILLFTMYQIPYVLPFVIPIASLISAILLIQKLSQHHELTAMRAAGLSLRQITAPLLLTAALLALCNFYIVSELATHAHLTSRLLKQELKSINPLILLHNTHLLHFKGVYVNTLGQSKVGESASDVIIATPLHNKKAFNMLIAKQIAVSDNPTHKKKEIQKSLQIQGAALITSLEGRPGAPLTYDPLMIENIAQAVSPMEDFAALLMLKDEVWRLNNDHLKMRLLLLRINEDRKLLDFMPASSAEYAAAKARIVRSTAEIIRRLSVAIAVFTFTLMGTAFGMTITRTRNARSVILVVGLAALYLVAFFMAKGWSNHLLLASALYTLPHVCIIGCSFRVLSRISRGVI